MNRLYFDVNTFTGRTKVREPLIPYRVEDLLDDMDRYRVHGALVQSAEARDYSYAHGNELLLGQLKGQSRLFATALVPPTLKYERPDRRGYLEDMKEAGVRGICVRPTSLVHSIDPMTMEEMSGFLLDNDLPLILDIQETGFDAVRTLLAAFPELKVLLLNVKWLFNRQLFPLLERFSGLHVDYSCNQVPDFPSIVKRHFGIERLLFGSGFPQKPMGPLKSMIEYSDVGEADKDAVAAGNAMRLFHIPQEALVPYQTPSRLDALAQRMEEGRPLTDVFIMDAHAHMIDARHGNVNFHMAFAFDEVNLVHMMDKLGVDQALVSPVEGLCTDGIASGETVRKAARAFPGRILPYACANPHFPEDIRGAIEAHRQHDFRGLKPYWVYHELPLTHETYAPWFSYANEHRLFMLIHSGEPRVVPEVRELSIRYPEITYLLGHSGISYKVARENAALARERPNVVLELNFTNLTRGVVEFLVLQAGADKVLYGTDMPLRDPGPQLGWVVYADLPREDKEKILGLNMKRIYERAIPHGTK